MDRKYEVVILGASGFTGRYVLREALKFHTSPLKTLAIAGRSASKLTDALTWASRPDPPPQIPILTADIADPDSLAALSRNDLPYEFGFRSDASSPVDSLTPALMTKAAWIFL